MVEKQQVYPIRRQYNQWVNDQTLEDYALRFTAKASRRWSLGGVAMTALGAISFLALEAIGAAMTISYGFENTLYAVLAVGLMIFLTGIPVCYYAAKYGVDIDLLTRGAGFGYLGSTATSVIYASFTFIFFALEAAIMAKALEVTIGIPLAMGYILSSVIIIPFVFYGITVISRFQLWTQPIWVILQVAPFIVIFLNHVELFEPWTEYVGSEQTEKGFDILLFGAASAVMFALIAQFGEQVDFLRFMPEKTKKNSFRWWSALILAGPGWIIIGGLKILLGSFLAVAAINYGATIIDASDPTTMYAFAFRFMTDNDHLALMVAGVFVVISQLKINVMNAYAGSIAWSNFFSRLTHSHPGRVVWLVFNVVIALLLMELGIYHAFENTLSVYAIVAVSWIGALTADLVINKPLGLSPKHIEFKRAYLHDINPVGIGAMIIASTLGILSFLNFFGEYFQALAHFITLALTFVFTPLIAWLTKSRYYTARPAHIFSPVQKIVQCNVCQNQYEREDMADCPVYGDFICSLCCTIDSRCHDGCKSDPSVSSKFIEIANQLFPRLKKDFINVRIINFLSLLAGVALITGLLLMLIFTNIRTDNLLVNDLISSTLWEVFFILLIISGVICWLFVLARQSQIVAQQETQKQTARLMDEITAHEITDRKLQKAKEEADASNLAKSRYLTGISHELRSPLNTILGYAQLLELDRKLDSSTLEKIATMKRSGEHLEDLIEGLLNISKIEAGRLEIQRNPIQFLKMIDQLDKMFTIQAEDKNLRFSCERMTGLPDSVMGDEKRIRQILINLITNAIKFTQSGDVKLQIAYRSQIAEFKIIDTGIGIDPKEYERILKPFERVRTTGHPSVPGTGLGLTICALFAEVMGGNLEIEPNPAGGTIFTVSLMLSSVDYLKESQLTHKEIFGYYGKPLTVMVVDDDATHRSLISDLLTPLGFHIIEAYDGAICLEMLESITPELFVIDRQMPGISGPTLARNIRSQNINVPILMVTANAKEDTVKEKASEQQTPAYNDYLIKPIRLQALLQSIEKYLDIRWRYTPIAEKEKQAVPQAKLGESLAANIIALADVGNLNGLKQIAKKLAKDTTVNDSFMMEFNQHIQDIRFNKIIELVEANI